MGVKYVQRGVCECDEDVPLDVPLQFLNVEPSSKATGKPSHNGHEICTVWLFSSFPLGGILCPCARTCRSDPSPHKSKN